MTGSSFTNYLSNALLNETLRNVNFVPPATVYVGLFTAAPTEAYTSGAPTGTEVSGGAYARQSAAFGAPTTLTPSGTQSATTADIIFPVATAAWGTITYVGVFDASAGGNLLYYFPVAVAQQIDSGSQFKFLTGNLGVQLD